MAISWNIWNDRNGVRHGEVPKTVSNLVFEATRIVEEYKALQDCHIPATNLLPALWTPPMSSAYKANVDGAVFNALSTAERLGNLLIQEANFLSGVSTQVELLQTELKQMQGLLKDADATQDESEAC
nr:hypothetical protein CFP56_25437 [Quercus suber]